MKRFLSSWLASFTKSPKRSRPLTQQRQVRLGVECLERRELMSASPLISLSQDLGATTASENFALKVTFPYGAPAAGFLYIVEGTAAETAAGSGLQLWSAGVAKNTASVSVPPMAGGVVWRGASVRATTSKQLSNATRSLETCSPARLLEASSTLTPSSTSSTAWPRRSRSRRLGDQRQPPTRRRLFTWAAQSRTPPSYNLELKDLTTGQAVVGPNGPGAPTEMMLTGTSATLSGSIALTAGHSLTWLAGAGHRRRWRHQQLEPAAGLQASPGLPHLFFSNWSGFRPVLGGITKQTVVVPAQFRR